MSTNIYALAWRLFSSKIASRRRKLISKDELMRWQLWALEEAIDQTTWDTVLSSPKVVIGKVPNGQQEKA